MGFTPLQHAYNDTGTGSTLIKAFTNNPAVGNVCVCVGFVWNGTSTTPTITIADGNSNTYTRAPHSPATGDPTGAGYAFAHYFIASGTPNKTITVTSSRSEQAITMWIMEFAVSGGTAAFDLDVAGVGASGTTINTPIVTVSGTGELLIGNAAPDDSVTTVNSPWTCPETLPVGHSDGAGYIVSASANTALNMTQPSSAGWASMGMSFTFTPAAAVVVIDRPHGMQRPFPFGPGSSPNPGGRL